MFTTEKPTLTLEELRRVPVTQPPGGAGKIWQGVQHGQIADALIDHGKHVHKLDIDRQRCRFWTTRDGGDVAGSLCIAPPDDKFGRLCERHCLQPYLGFTASNRQESVLTVYCGVGDPTTGARIIPLRMKRNKDVKWMYTTLFDFSYVTNVVWRWWLRHKEVPVDAWERITEASAVTPGRLNNLLVALGRKEILPWSRVGTCDRAFAGSASRSHYDFLGAAAVPLSMANPIEQLVNGWKLTLLVDGILSKKAKV